MQPKIEYNKCLQDGAIGGVGAIPGTFCAHFCDVIKIRQQLTGERLKHAVTSIYQGGGNEEVYDIPPRTSLQEHYRPYNKR